MENKTKPILPVLLVAVLVVAGVLLFMKYRSSTPATKFSSENVIYDPVDVASVQGQSKLPAGLPSDIPIEIENVTQSETLSYPDRKATVSNVSYFSAKQQEELSVIYANYLKDKGYKITLGDKSVSHTAYIATKGNGELTITITPNDQRMNVLLSFVVRQ
ncbi:MAG: hypothetical protein JWN89_546 [Parcubacteria group bacterium]|nr:hypothetical protein [Parcubacteria group bacterium]